ncbi:unnamed protein product, partial [Bubo scandiacus]
AGARSIRFTLALCITHKTNADNDGMTALLSSTCKQEACCYIPGDVSAPCMTAAPTQSQISPLDWGPHR